MIDQDDDTPPAKPKRGIPAAALSKLKPAVKAHFAVHEGRNRRLLREDPKFSPWIGYDVGKSGETGDKRLDRLFQEVEREAALAKRLRSHALPNPSRPEAETSADPLGRVLAGGSPVVGFAELQASLRSRRQWIERAMNGCLEVGQLDDALKLSREHRAIIRDSAALAASFNAAMKSAELQKRLLAAAFESHAGDDAKAQALAGAIDQIFDEFTGLSARGEGQ